MANPEPKLNPLVLSVVAALCIVSLGLILLLPLESLVVDLVYQKF